MPFLWRKGCYKKVVTFKNSPTGTIPVKTTFQKEKHHETPDAPAEAADKTPTRKQIRQLLKHLCKLRPTKQQMQMFYNILLLLLPILFKTKLNKQQIQTTLKFLMMILTSIITPRPTT